MDVSIYRIMEQAIVQVENLSHRYNIQWAIRDINFEISQNGVYGLLGSNGAGKSTTMNIMCGVLRPTQGKVLVNGVDICKHPIEAKHYIGFLPQKPPLHMELTVEEYLIHCANMRQIAATQIKEALEKVLERCKINHFRKRLIRNLSGGYQQRVGIAQAIIHEPKIVVLDEPTNGLDPNQIVEIRHLIKEIAEERTVILSTHILPEVQATCDYIQMIEQGSLVFSGTVSEFDNYITPNTILVNWAAAPSIMEMVKIPGILQVDELGGNKYRLHFTGSSEVLENIIETSVARDWRLIEISLERSSLDTIFAELSRRK